MLRAQLSQTGQKTDQEGEATASGDTVAQEMLFIARVHKSRR
jgi:hypothetical protein